MQDKFISTIVKIGISKKFEETSVCTTLKSFLAHKPTLLMQKFLNFAISN